jgi:hypothetical protein
MLLAIAIASLAFANVAAAQDAPDFSQGRIIKSYNVSNPEKAGGDLKVVIVSGNGPAPLDPVEYPRVQLQPRMATSSTSAVQGKTTWNSICYYLRNTDKLIMWYTVEKYWEYNKTRHRVTFQAINGHWGGVNWLAQALGWDYKGDNLNASTFKLYNGYYHGQHFTRYIGHFVCKPVGIPITVARRDPQNCISVRYNGTKSFAGSTS